MTIFELGALGEFIGSIGVVATLIYLAIQIRLNTMSMDENKQSIVAQTYQARSDSLMEINLRMAENIELSALVSKIGSGGWDIDLTRTEELTESEHIRLRLFYFAQRIRLDNLVFQHQQGFMTDEHYQDGIKGPLRFFHPIWEYFGITGGRPSFVSEIEKAVAETTS